jgi:hypothetical protein
MKFSYSDFWKNKCSSKQYIDPAITKLALALYESTNTGKNKNFDVDALHSLIVKQYQFDGLNSVKYKDELLSNLKGYLTKIKIGKSKHLNKDDDLSKLTDARFNKIFESFCLNACIQYNLRTKFVNLDEPPEQLLEYIKQGYSYSWHFKGNYRTGSNYECSDIICIDIDDMQKYDSLDAVKEDTLIAKYALIVHPSSSYDALMGNLKCRVIFRLENTVYSAEDFTRLNNGLKDYFKSDPMINIDSCLYGCNKNLLLINDHSMIEFKPNNFLPQAEIDKFIIIGKSLSNATSNKSNTTVPSIIARQNHSTLACPESPFQEYYNRRLEFIHHQDVIDTQVVENICSTINSTNPSVNLLCPYHNDTSASAWITSNTTNSNYMLKCSAIGCIETRWITNPTYHEMSRTLIESTNSTSVVQSRSRLSPLPTIPGVHIIRSQKGSGKTFRLAQLLKSLPQETSILAVTHLRSLARNIAQRLSLECYIDDHDDIPGIYSDRFICGMASLFNVFCDYDPNIKPRKYNILVLDEFEQLLEQLFNNDFIFNSNRRRDAISVLNQLFINADTVYILDADIGYVSIGYVDMLLKEKKRLKLNQYVDYTLNEYPHNREVQVCSDKTHFYSEVLKALNLGENSILVSNRRKELVHIYYTLIFYAKSKNYNGFKILLIDGYSSEEDQRVKNFIVDPTVEAQKYHFVLYNQAMVSGVSIDCTDYFKNVFGYFFQTIKSNSTTTPFANSQMLNRYRSDKAPFKLWIESYKVKKKPQRPAISGNSFLDNVINKLETNCNTLFNDNFTDYYRSHMAYFIECGYKIKILDLTESEFNYADRVFSHDTSMFYYLTEDFSKDVFKKLSQQDQDKYKLLDKIFRDLNFDIHLSDLTFSPNSKNEILKTSTSGLLRNLKRSSLSLAPIKQSSIAVKKPKTFLRNIFKNIHLEVVDGPMIGSRGKSNRSYKLSINWESFRLS